MTIHRTVVSALAILLVFQTTSVMGETNIELRHELIELCEEQSRKHAINVTRLREIISKYGWPGRSMVGRDGATAAFLILQHADHETQVEYLPLVKTAVEAGEFERRHFALLQDQILVAEEKPQIFGTQLYWDDTTGKLELFPIEDEAKVYSRREAYGMMPLAEYVERVRGDN